MKPDDVVRFHPERWIRRLCGPLFAAACLLATCTGVVVLVLLLVSHCCFCTNTLPSAL